MIRAVLKCVTSSTRHNEAKVRCFGAQEVTTYRSMSPAGMSLLAQKVLGHGTPHAMVTARTATPNMMKDWSRGTVLAYGM